MQCPTICFDGVVHTDADSCAAKFFEVHGEITWRYIRRDKGQKDSATKVTRTSLPQTFKLMRMIDEYGERLRKKIMGLLNIDDP